MGRKPLPAKLAKNHRIAVMVTEDEAKRLEKARKELGFVTVSDLVRSALDQFVKSALK